MQEFDTPTRDVGQEAGTDVKRSAERLQEDARQTAENLGARASEEANRQADRAKSGVASELSGIASALGTAADELRHGSPQEQVFGQVAKGLSGVSDAIRDRDLAEIASDVSAFARRNPLGFLGGAALAGFAATRFAKASSAARDRGTETGNEPSATMAPVPATQPPADMTTPETPMTGSAPATRPDDVMAPPVIPSNPKTTGEY
ncbi:hypothetical protein [Pseudooceanicola algae]|uniref:Uncharacterized protein n=1 Tax=Pseudooceanicola algae TaxID=1537215 RepID=A0A418SBJ9_9RHOB|nr:hypothetical protein [Pseudooceanicola algae]QPM92497.1 hypothetical protein PSAL_037610 [Pseudooceanicola algae]